MARRFRIRVSVRTGLWLAGAALVLGLTGPQAWAWHHLRSAREALARYHPEQARVELESCKRMWWGHETAHLLAARAAWQESDVAAALEELRAVQNLKGGATAETAFEWALIQAAGGNFSEVGEYLQQRIEQSPDQAPLIWEALVEGYLRVYRPPDAMACLKLWLDRDPENVRALELRGRTYVSGRGVVRGAEDFRKVLALDPERKQTRWRLIGCLLDMGSYDDAIPYLEQMARETPDDPEIAARLARCYLMSLRSDDAARLLDSALVKHPRHALCLRTRGQLSLTQDKPAEAESSLRRAVEAQPEDYQSQWLLAEAIRRQGRIEDARAQLKKAEEVRERSERLGELQSRKIAEQPLDPSLHYEMGMLMMRGGKSEMAVQAFLAALRLDPDHRPSHAALADYYAKIGDKVRADEHRRKASAPEPEPR